MKRILIYLLTIFTLSGCATLGIEKPKTFRETEAYAIATEATVHDSATTAFQRGKISASVRDKIYAGIRAADSLLMEADQISKMDLTTANAKLDAALKIIKDLKDELKQNGVLN